MTNDRLAIISELQPIAKRMRERQEAINRDKQNVYAKIAELIGVAQEQGLDCLTVKAKIASLKGSGVKWSEWLSAHVPTLTEQDANKYERLTNEQLSDPRQCVFAFLPPAEAKQQYHREPPNEREIVWGRIGKLAMTFKSVDISAWVKEDIELTKKELEPVAKRLWPERF